MFGHYQINGKTRVVDETQFEDVGVGYAFYCIGNPEDGMRTFGVGLAILSVTSMPDWVQTM